MDTKDKTVKKFDLTKALKEVEKEDCKDERLNRTVKDDKITTTYYDIIRHDFVMGYKEINTLKWKYPNVAKVMDLIEQIQKFHKRYNAILKRLEETYVVPVFDKKGKLTEQKDVPEGDKKEYEQMLKDLEDTKIVIKHKCLTIPANSETRPGYFITLDKDFFKQK